MVLKVSIESPLARIFLRLAFRLQTFCLSASTCCHMFASLMVTTGFTKDSQLGNCMSKLSGLPGLAGLKEVR